MARRVTEDVDFYVGDIIRERRVQLGISQATLSGALGVSQQQLQKYESGKNRISPSRMAQIAHALDVPPHFFFGGAAAPKASGEGDVPVLDDVRGFVSSTEGLKLIKAFSRLPRDLQRSVVVLVDKVVKNEGS